MRKNNCVAPAMRRLIFWFVVAALAMPTLQAQSQRAIEVLHERLLPLFEDTGVVFTDADETTDRLVVGVVDRGAANRVRARIPALGVLSQLVDIVETEPIVQVSSLSDSIRPIVAGLQIHFSQYVCSIGFNAYLNNVAGFVTASHCSAKQGTVDGAVYYQPLSTVSPTPIATEIADPAYTRIEGCPKGKVCRYSDSNFAQFGSGANWTLGQIAKTTDLNSLDIAGYYSIFGEGGEKKNDTVNKVGRTTGWTQGTLTNTCANTAVSGSRIVLLCQNFVTSTATVVMGGDSGSPVFKIRSGDKVDLLGNLWGGNTSGTQFVYSPIANIKQELGAALRTH